MKKLVFTTNMFRIAKESLSNSRNRKYNFRERDIKVNVISKSIFFIGDTKKLSLEIQSS